MIQLKDIIKDDSLDNFFSYGIKMINTFSVCVTRMNNNYTVNVVDYSSGSMNDYKMDNKEEVNELLRSLQEPYIPKDERDFKSALGDLLSKNNIELLKN